MPDTPVENGFVLPICYLWAAHDVPPAANKWFQNRMQHPQPVGELHMPTFPISHLQLHELIQSQKAEFRQASLKSFVQGCVHWHAGEFAPLVITRLHLQADAPCIPNRLASLLALHLCVLTESCGFDGFISFAGLTERNSSVPT